MAALSGWCGTAWRRPAGDGRRPGRLAIDRAFGVKGRGAVVTGTLWGRRCAAARCCGASRARCPRPRGPGPRHDRRPREPGRTALNLLPRSIPPSSIAGSHPDRRPRIRATDRLLVRLATMLPDGRGRGPYRGRRPSTPPLVGADEMRMDLPGREVAGSAARARSRSPRRSFCGASDGRAVRPASSAGWCLTRVRRVASRAADRPPSGSPGWRRPWRRGTREFGAALGRSPPYVLHVSLRVISAQARGVVGQPWPRTWPRPLPTRSSREPPPVSPSRTPAPSPPGCCGAGRRISRTALEPAAVPALVDDLVRDGRLVRDGATVRTPGAIRAAPECGEYYAAMDRLEAALRRPGAAGSLRRRSRHGVSARRGPRPRTEWPDRGPRRRPCLCRLDLWRDLTSRALAMAAQRPLLRRRRYATRPGRAAST